ncbi:metallo-beta-lactamase superfamily protein [Tritrichomonas foetus]|uniref:ribonuclease Z n=1 Tax=Tritrichomonas foetus TaxID=1144522 RepID=A0A1J4JY28_9EUKA|nr:metallo-beta-lactamase superfamily protein [Tritrichomonas foetus]|eukprot:OHT03594.1 metallo-beta-lactamase superfamily protein [Tritrichomonas foetus]
MKLLHVLSGRTPDTHPMILLNIEEHYYLINAPDGAERIFLDMNISIPRLEKILLTSCHSSSIAGFFAVTIAYEASSTSISQSKRACVMGPESLIDIYKNSSYCHNFGVPLPNLSESFDDGNISVKLHKLVNSVFYEIKFCDEPGHFLPSKAKQLGVKPGPDFKKLTNGEDIILSDEKKVTLNDCISETVEGEILAVIDCKTEDDVNMLIEYDMNPKIKTIIHLTKPELMNTQEYYDKFFKDDKTFTNLTFYDDKENVLFNQVALIHQKYVQMMNNCLYPISSFENHLERNGNLINLKSGDSFVFAPNKKRGLVCKKVKNENRNENNTNMCGNVEKNVLLSEIKSFAVTFLGTGAKKLTIMRNPAGILIHTKFGFIVLDAGEGFTGQLYRKFGKESGDYILQNIIAIWVSHQHIDHYFGLHQLLDKRQEILNQLKNENGNENHNNTKIPFISDVDLIKEVKSYERNNYILNKIPDDKICSEQTKYYDIDYCNFDEPQNKKIELFNGKIKMESVEVMHMIYSKGIKITIDNQYFIGYSGDRSLEDNFVESVGTVDFLIHEATFTQNFVDKMHKKRHSTIEGAIETGKKMNAKFIALTHISNRYDGKFISVEEENAFVAFDFLTVTLENCQNIIPLIKSAQTEIFQPINE